MTTDTGAAPLVVYSTISCREALTELVPVYERSGGGRIDATCLGGPDLARRIREGLTGDVFIGPADFSTPLLAEGKLLAGSRVPIASSMTGLAVRAGQPKPDISTPDRLRAALLAAGGVSYSAGASGLYFEKLLETLGIKDAVLAKRVPARPGELIGAVVARGESEIAVQQISELLPVPGIELLDPLPAELQQKIVYGASLFPQTPRKDAAEAFVGFLRSAPAREVLRHAGLDPDGV